MAKEDHSFQNFFFFFWSESFQNKFAKLGHHRRSFYKYKTLLKVNCLESIPPVVGDFHMYNKTVQNGVGLNNERDNTL